MLELSTEHSANDKRDVTTRLERERARLNVKPIHRDRGPQNIKFELHRTHIALISLTRALSHTQSRSKQFSLPRQSNFVMSLVTSSARRSVALMRFGIKYIYNKREFLSLRNDEKSLGERGRGRKEFYRAERERQKFPALPESKQEHGAAPRKGDGGRGEFT